MSDAEAREVAALRDADAIEQMLATPGWQVFKRAIDAQFGETVMGLRSCRSWETTLRQQGRADGIDWARQLPVRLANELRGKAGNHGD